ncbi:uncharacterized protein LOC141909911 [Tubulanus polymorphus]|uniref:uncharacterized protein LOC141909911 n=1 Tax=Tubulanus polymorphus TaxID=672921 RepID=UPI003DA453FB
MGSPVSPIVCNLYMEDFEQKAIATALHPPRIWKRYVDDTCTVLKKCFSQYFTDHLNSIDDDIKWTTEGEVELQASSQADLEICSVERALAFLDTYAVINEDGSIRTKVFRKTTHTDQYLNFNSNHPLEHKRGVVKTLLHRADTIVSDDSERQSEKQHIKEVLSWNDYPNWVFNKVTMLPKPKPVVRNKRDTQAPRKRSVVVPYVKGMSEQIRRVMKDYNISVYFKPVNTLRQLLVRPKDPVPKERITGPVYHVKCESCDASYVGETERSSRARFGEHRRPSSMTSEVSQHIHTDNPDHSVDIGNTDILTVEPRWFERGVQESFCIYLRHPTLNKDFGRFALPPVWNNIFKAADGAREPSQTS